MNYDPTRFCFECKKLKPAKGFRPLSRVPGNVRLACAECFDTTAIGKSTKANNPKSTERKLWVLLPLAIHLWRVALG